MSHSSSVTPSDRSPDTTASTSPDTDADRASSDAGRSTPTAHGAPSSRTRTDTRLLADDDRVGLRADWANVEQRFVDDPAGAVRAADDLLGEVIEHIRTALDERRPAAGANWTAVDEATTEQLREALHRYDVLFDQLIDTPRPDSWRSDRSSGAQTTSNSTTATEDKDRQ